MKFSIRLLYLYLFSFIGLLIAVIGGVRLVQLGIKIYVFGGADRYPTYIAPAPFIEDGKSSQTDEQIREQKNINEEEGRKQRQREIAEAAAMILVGGPLYLYHWKTIQKEGKRYRS
jgi:hypothetical protein